MGSATGQGVDVGNGGTLQFNLTPQSAPKISTGANVSVEPNGALIVAASTPLVDSTGKFIGVGNNGVGYTIVQGTSGTGSELQDRLTTKYVPAVQLGGEWYGQIGKKGQFKRPYWLQTNAN